MKFIKWILIAIVSLLLVLTVVGFFLPQTLFIERTAIVGNTRDAIYTQVNSMQRFNEWSPWYQLDPQAQYNYSGPTEGVGNKVSWNSENPNVGVGTSEIVENQYPSMVKNELLFGDESNPAVATFTIEEITFKQSRVTWDFNVDFGNNIIGRYQGLIMKGELEKLYQKGLDNLKAQLEG